MKDKGSTCVRPGFCDSCPISKYTKGYIKPWVVEDSNKLLVGEAAGENEVQVGKPFVGLAGGYLNQMLKDAGQPRNEWNVVNVIGCQPIKNIFPGSNEWVFTDKKTAKEGIAHCAKHHLNPFLKSKKWNKIVALGEKALNATTGKVGITHWRGSPLKNIHALNNAPTVMPTYHPSYVGRMSKFYGVVVNDIHKSLILPKNEFDLDPDLSSLQDWMPKEFAFDLEWNTKTDEITICGISDGFYKAKVFTWSDKVEKFLKERFENATDLIGWNIISADLPYFEKFGWNITARLHDTMLKQHLIHPDYKHTLAFASSVFSNFPFWKGRGKEEDDEAADLSGAPQYKTWDKPWAIPRVYGGYGGCKSEDEAFKLYNAYDTARSFEIETPINNELKKHNLEDLYWNVSLPVAIICKDITTKGWKLDTSKFAEIKKNLDKKIFELDAQLPEGLKGIRKEANKLIDAPPNTYKAKIKRCRNCSTEVEFVEPGEKICTCGREIGSGKMTTLKKIKIPITKVIYPWKSPQKIKEYAKSVGLKPGINKKTENETVDKHVRSKWAIENKAFVILNDLTKLYTLRKTFAKDSLYKESEMFFKILVHGTAEGRVSSSGKRKGIDLNIQNQPKEIRKIYIPDSPTEGILNSDWVSGENTLTAWFSEDWERIEQMRSTPDYDEHAELGRMIFNMECGKGTEGEYLRRPSKIVNHGMGYGMGWKTLLANLHNAGFYHYTPADSKEFIEIWRKLRAKTFTWQNQIIAQVNRDGYLENPFGRKRWFTSRGWEGQALAFLPASTLADMMLRCMIALYPKKYSREIHNLDLQVARELPKSWYLRAQVHDSLVTIGEDSNVEEAKSVVGDVMSQPFKALNNFYLLTDHEYSGKGGSWGECK